MCLKPKGGELKCRVASSKIMKKRNYFQCSKCGNIHYIYMMFDIESELYTTLFCEQCGEETPQLWVGENPEDKFIYMDRNIDPNYYLY